MAREALSELTRSPGAFDLLITDHSMPRMNGMELVRRLRDTAFLGKIVVLSAHLSAENRAAYFALGVDMMIPEALRCASSARGHQANRKPRATGARADGTGGRGVYKLLRLGLLETEATPKPDTTPGWEGDTRSTVI